MLVRELLELLLRTMDVVFAHVLGLDRILRMTPNVPDGDPSVLRKPMDDLDELLAALLGQ